MRTQLVLPLTPANTNPDDKTAWSSITLVRRVLSPSQPFKKGNAEQGDPQSPSQLKTGRCSDLLPLPIDASMCNAQTI
jgi:hypothetical protein